MIDQVEVKSAKKHTDVKQPTIKELNSESRKVVALDYDDTLTSNPYAWLAVAAILHNGGFDVYIVTYRYDNAEESSELEYLKHYDDTLTSNPYAWLAVAAILHNSGFDVYIVTYRYDNAEESSELEYLKHYDYISGIVFTGRKAKDATCRKLGIYVSIWIDDNPITITHSMKGMLNSYTPVFKSDTHHAIDLTIH